MFIYFVLFSLNRIFAVMKLSVVIPVYRVEDTLDRCVESVVNQSVDDLEVILVDDGSPDHCPQQCDNWVTRDRRICVIHQQNGGLSAARNAGIEKATGDYITFVDSDDYLAEDTYRPLLRQLSLHPEYDILEYPIAQRLSLTDQEYHDMNDYWLGCKAYLHTFAWNKIYRRVLFNLIRYPQGKVFEDVYTLPLLLQQVKVLATTSTGCYHYTKNPQGITATADGTALTMLLDAHLQHTMPMDDAYYLHLANIQMDVWERTKAPLRLPRRHLNTNRFQGRERWKAIAINIIGLQPLCKINKIIHLFKTPSRW